MRQRSKFVFILAAFVSALSYGVMKEQTEDLQLLIHDAPFSDPEWIAIILNGNRYALKDVSCLRDDLHRYFSGYLAAGYYVSKIDTRVSTDEFGGANTPRMEFHLTLSRQGVSSKSETIFCQLR